MCGKNLTGLSAMSLGKAREEIPQILTEQAGDVVEQTIRRGGTVQLKTIKQIMSSYA